MTKWCKVCLVVGLRVKYSSMFLPMTLLRYRCIQETLQRDLHYDTQLRCRFKGLDFNSSLWNDEDGSQSILLYNIHIFRFSIRTIDCSYSRPSRNLFSAILQFQKQQIYYIFSAAFYNCARVQNSLSGKTHQQWRQSSVLIDLSCELKEIQREYPRILFSSCRHLKLGIAILSVETVVWISQSIHG